MQLFVRSLSRTVAVEVQPLDTAVEHVKAEIEVTSCGRLGPIPCKEC